MTQQVYDFVVPDDTWTYPTFTPFTVFLNAADTPVHTFIDKTNSVTRVIFLRGSASADAMRKFVFVPEGYALPEEAVYWLRREEWEGAAEAAYLFEITDVTETITWPEPPVMPDDPAGTDQDPGE